MAGSCPRILVADDDFSVRELVRARLEIAGYGVTEARNGAEALDRIREIRPDAVVLDINMPVLDGLAVLKSMRDWAAAHRPPVLLLTARNSSEDVSAAIRLGAKDYLAKPFDAKQLLARVGRLLRSVPQPATARKYVIV